MKTYAAWTKKTGTNEQLVTTLIKAGSIKEATAKLKALNRDIDGKPYKY